VRIILALDCCAREIISHVATSGTTGKMVRDLMIESLRLASGRLPDFLMPWNGSATMATLADNEHQLGGTDINPGSGRSRKLCRYHRRGYSHLSCQMSPWSKA